MKNAKLNYIIIELQTYENGTVGSIVTQKESYEEAQSVFHSILASAAVSNLPCHSATILNNRGGVIETKYFMRIADDEIT